MAKMEGRLALAATVLLFAQATTASELSSTYLELGKIELESDYVSNVDGYRLHGNFDLVGGFYLTADWWQYDTKHQYEDADLRYSSKTEVDWLMPGAGFRLPVSTAMHFAGELSYVRLEMDSQFRSQFAGEPVYAESERDTEEGVGLKLLWRWRPLAQLEMAAEAQRIDIDSEHLDLYAASLRWHLTERVSVGYEHQEWRDSDTSRQNLNLRLSF